MNLADIHTLLEIMLQRNQLPSFIIGVLLGIVLVVSIMRLTRGRRTSGLARELRDQISRMTADNRGLKEENEGLGRERDLLNDKVKGQDGWIAAMGQQAAELSAECERLSTELVDTQGKLSTELVDTQGKLKLERKARRAAQALAKVYSDQLDDIAKSDGKIWLKPTNGQVVRFLPLSVRRTVIISLANLKGGVGKTTMAANLGAALAAEGLRVLLIDFDHQSSLTNLCLLPGERDEVKRSRCYIDNVFSGSGDFAALNRCVTLLKTQTGSGQLYLAPVREEFFADLENQLMTRWHSGQTTEDVRFRLRGALHTPELRDHYDAVIIDCPPRLTTGSINALAASDYVLIPVLLEDTSAEAVPRILGWLKRFQMTACEELNVLGVVGNKANPRKKLITREQAVWSALPADCLHAWGRPVHFFEEVIREHPVVNGRFASLDPRYQAGYGNLITQIRREIPHAHLQPPAVHPLASAPAGGGRD